MPWQRTRVFWSTRMVMASPLALRDRDRARRRLPHIGAQRFRKAKALDAHPRDILVVAGDAQDERQYATLSADSDAEAFDDGVVRLHAAAIDVDEDHFHFRIVEYEPDALRDVEALRGGADVHEIRGLAARRAQHVEGGET